MKLFFSILSLFLISNSTAFSNEYSDPEESRLIEKISRMEKDLNVLQKQFYRNVGKSSQKNIVESTINDDVSNTLPSFEIKLSNLEEQIRSLIGNFEQIEHSINSLNQKFEKISADNEFRFNELEKKLAEKPSESKILPEGLKKTETKKDPELPQAESEKNLEVKLKEKSFAETEKVEKQKLKKETVKAEFDNAFALIRASKTAEAEEAFKKFIEKNPQGDYSARSSFWLGEINLLKKNYDVAAINFLQSYKKAPESNKAPDSLMKLATSLGNLKRNKEACSILTKLQKEFPKMDDKIEAKYNEQIKKLSCK